ncbi:MAG: class II aldolase/adducin family protein [Gammaproteobacteria bacterium]|nr:class II aldolase/adducin family protein [Gammaproteobacteria bacterium]MDH3464628.1 class II aldolase/adducin family protein [Gammaproteobacteria bacterium]
MSAIKSTKSAVTNISDAEHAIRIDLAAAYRLLAKFGMTDLIYTHISARVPGTHEQFLINPYGWLFDEITASSLVKIDLDGNILDGPKNDVNRAGFVIHSAVHAARSDVECVVHTHTKAGMAVAACRTGLLPVNQISMQFYNRVAYHDYEGISLELDERERLVADLGGHDVMILRNHGLLTAGRSVASAFSLMFYLNRACEIQLAAQAMGELVLPSDEVCEHAAQQFAHSCSETIGNEREWSALLRILDRDDAGYRQ